MDINGAPATHAFRNQDVVVAYGRPSRTDNNFIVETTEGMRRKLPSIAEAKRWLGALEVDAVQETAEEAETKKKSTRKAA